MGQKKDKRRAGRNMKFSGAKAGISKHPKRIPSRPILGPKTRVSGGRMDERRKTERVPFSHPITLIMGKKRYRGMVENLSLKGLYVHSKAARACGFDKTLSLYMPLSSVSRKPCFHGKARIARKNHEGIGLYIMRMSGDDLMHLRRIIESNSGHAENIKKQLRSFLVV